MKTSFNLLLMAFAIFIISACSGKPDARSFIPGTYVNRAEGEFSIANDTLVIQVLSEENNTYRISKNTAFRRIKARKLTKVQREKEIWVAVYDENTHSMEETRKGKVITIYPGSGMIIVGKREYRKLGN